MAQERAANQQVSGLDSINSIKILSLRLMNEIGLMKELKFKVKDSTFMRRVFEAARTKWGLCDVQVEIRFNAALIQPNQRVGELGIPDGAELYMEKVEYKQAEEAPKVKTDDEPLDPENDENEATKENEEPKRELTKEEKKRLHKLWQWKNSIDMQEVSHIGSEETANPWKVLQGKRKMDVAQNPELFNHLAALHYAYLKGFTGPAKRQRTL